MGGEVRAMIGSRDGARTSWSDWIGCLFYALCALGTLASAPALGVLLLPTILHEALVAIAFFTRTPARRTLGGWVPRVVAYAGSLGLMVFIQIAKLALPSALVPTTHHASLGLGAMLWLAGLVLGIWAIWHLRRAFSLEPAARTLVTTGPYRFARHPIYTGYLLQYGGMWLMYPTAILALALGAWLVLMIARIQFEETVLGQAFPDHAAYRRRVGALMPSLAGLATRRLA
jgi:protein-S-isoprenylcysteine O-methyltransferase Ste14